MIDECLTAKKAVEMTIDAQRALYPLSEKCIDDLDDAIINAAKKGHSMCFCKWDDKVIDRDSVDTAANYFRSRGFIVEIIYAKTYYQIQLSWYVNQIR